MHSDRSFAWLGRSLDVHELQFHRLAHRRLIVHLFRRYLSDYYRRHPSKDVGCICLVGSVARGEFDVENSDIDLWFLGMDIHSRNDILRAVAREFRALDIGLTKDDLGLVLRNEGKALERNWKKFPCLDEADFLSSGVRRSQILFETVAVNNLERHVQLQRTALRASGVSVRGRDVRQDPTQLYDDISAYSSALEVHEHKDAVAFAKQVVSRRLAQHLMRLSVLEAVFRKRAVVESPAPDNYFIEILQTPTASKALFWASAEFFHGSMMTKIASPDFRSINRDLNKIVRNVDSGFSGGSDPRRAVGHLAILATRQYSAALNLLHSASFRSTLRENPDFAFSQHAADANLNQVVATAKRFASCCVALVEALDRIFKRYDAAGLFSRPYEGSGLEAAVIQTQRSLLNDPFATGP